MARLSNVVKVVKGCALNHVAGGPSSDRPNSITCEAARSGPAPVAVGRPGFNVHVRSYAHIVHTFVSLFLEKME